MKLRIALLMLAVNLSFSSRVCADDCSQRRAGYPERIAWYAWPSNTRAYDGYYVGGGAAIGGSRRCANEGTWGWDYSGWLLPHRVLLYWTHGRLYQGGTGAYKVNGPPLPDAPALLNPAVHSHAIPHGDQ